MSTHARASAYTFIHACTNMYTTPGRAPLSVQEPVKREGGFGTPACIRLLVPFPDGAQENDNRKSRKASTLKTNGHGIDLSLEIDIVVRRAE
mmetsp:Transcript_43341/g.94881  ORF Transcript_43341/g.94881 Transcript_43341/m.94881 type:complete len:92 (-) Transcript_43341:296-571(-)